jgi:hypothetical protein
MLTGARSLRSLIEAAGVNFQLPNAQLPNAGGRFAFGSLVGRPGVPRLREKRGEAERARSLGSCGVVELGVLGDSDSDGDREPAAGRRL